MEYLIGLVLAITVAAIGTMVGFDRERSFYATILIVIAYYYVLFAVMGASSRTLMLETAIASACCYGLQNQSLVHSRGDHGPRRFRHGPSRVF